MPTRDGRLDEISEAIGRLNGLAEGLERYTHEQAHGVNNLSMKLDAMALEQAKRHESLKTELSKQMEKLATTLREEIAGAVARIAVLESAQQRQAGAAGLAVLILKSPALGWLFLAAVALWAFLTGKVR